jgi:outer membrane putative beta-barrel porin/alpha-amylase
MRACLCITLVLLCASPLVAQESPASAQHGAPPSQDADQDHGFAAVPNRPTITTTAETVFRGVLELEYGFELADGHQNANGLLKWGIFRNLELRFANNPFERDGGVTGITDTGVGFKWRALTQKGNRPTVSLLYTASLPTATNGLGAGGVGHSIQLLVSKDFGRHRFDVNEGPQFVARPRGGFDRNYFTSLSYSHPVTEKLGATAEAAGFSKTNASTPASMVLLGAFTYNVTPRLVLDAGALVTVYGNQPRVIGVLGFTYAISDLYHFHAKRQPSGLAF